MTRPTMHAWADGWGTWHVRIVRDTESDTAARAMARRAILAGLGTDTRGTRPVVRLRLVSRSVSPAGWTYHYVERG
jgi:hypothetical protein